MPSGESAPRVPRRARVTSLRASVLWASGGSVVYLACQYGILVAIAKLGTPADVGTFALATAVTAPVVILSQMQLRQLQVTDVRGEASYGDYLTSRLLATLVALGVLGVVVAVIAGYDRRLSAVTAAVALAKAFESVSDIAHGKLQREERMDLVARSLAFKGLGSLATFAAVFAVTRDLTWAAVALATVWLVVLLGYDLPSSVRLSARGEARPRWRHAIARRLAWTALPLAATSGLVSLSGNVPRYFLEAFSGKEAVALFTAAATPLAALSLGTAALSQATLPRAAEYFQTGQNGVFVTLTAKIVMIQILAGAVAAITLAFAGEPIMTLLFAPEYAASGPLAAVMAAGMTLGGIAAYGATVIAAGRRFSTQLLHIVLVVVVQLPLCYLLTRRAGLWGAAWSEFARYGVSTIFLTLAGYVVHRRALEAWSRRVANRWHVIPIGET